MSDDVREGTFGSKAAFSNVSRRESRKSRNRKVFHQAVVVDFISNPVEDLQRSNDNDFSLRNSLLGELEGKSIHWIDRMPRNSIVAWRTGSKGVKGHKWEIFYPFFSPHLCLPVKAGEKVWVIYESAGDTDTLGYWISRVTGDEDVDDINYTHMDRRVSNIKETQGPQKSAMEASEGEEEAVGDIPNPLGFPPGGGRDRGRNTLPDQGNITGYEAIIETSDSYNTQYTPEPIPRFSKRSPDLSLQGSNNTLITLGEDRGRAVDDLFASSTPVDPDVLNTITTMPQTLGKGTIDIVAGRSTQLADGTFIYDKIADLEDSSSIIVSSGENPTAPAAVAKNARAVGEVDKNPEATKGNEDGPNINEGDPDFIYDLSRIYVSMKTDGDFNFGLEYPVLNDGIVVEPIDEEPYVVLRSNQIRVIAKYSEDQGINGSIKIIKEGVEDDEGGSGRAVIIMQPDGTIMIDGPKIIIGSGIDKAPGAGEQVFIGRDATESIVLGDKLNSLLLDLLNEMLTAAPTYVATAVGPGVMNPAVVTALGILIGELEAKSNLSTIGKTK